MGHKSKASALFFTLLFLVGCKIQVETSPYGLVRTTDGSFTCSPKSICTIEVDDHLFDQRFVAEPIEGYEFVGWVKRHKGLCGGTKEACYLTTSQFSDRPILDLILQSDSEFYLMPNFRSKSVEGAPIELEILFPTAGSLTYETSVAVSGIVSGAGGDGNFSVDIYGVNERLVVTTTSSGGKWSVNVPLKDGLNNFTAVLSGGEHTAGDKAFSVEKGLGVLAPTSPVVDMQTKSMFVIDGNTLDFSNGIPPTVVPGMKSLIEIDLFTGIRRIFSGPGVGGGPDFITPSRLLLDTRGGRFIVYDSSSHNIFEVNRETGVRRIAVNFQTASGLGNKRFSIEAFYLDEANNRALVVLEPGDGGLQFWSVNLKNYEVGFLYDVVPSVGRFLGDDPFAISSLSNTAFGFVSDLNKYELYRIDLTSGSIEPFSPSVTVISNSSSDTSINLENIETIAFDELEQALYIAGSRRVQVGICSCLYDVIVRVDISSGSHRDFVVLDNYLGNFGEIVVGSGSAIYAVDRSQDRVFSINKSTGQMRPVSDSSRGVIHSRSDWGAMAFDSGNGRLVIEGVTETSIGMWLEVDLATGERRELIRQDIEQRVFIDGVNESEFDSEGQLVWVHGNGQLMYRTSLDDKQVNSIVDMSTVGLTSGLCFDDRTGLAYTVSFNRQKIYAVDLDSGVIDTLDTDYDVQSISAVACDESNRRIIAIGDSGRSIVGISTETGEYETISGNGVGRGELFQTADDISIGQNRGVLFVSEYSANRVFMVDLNTGDRTVIYSETTGRGPTIERLRAVEVYNKNAVFVDGAEENRIIAIDVATGDRVIVSN